MKPVTPEIYSNGGFHCIFKSTAWGGKMTRVSWIYEEGWRELWSLSHSKAGVPPNQTGPVTHHICPFQHADAHRRMDLLMEGSGFWVRGSAVHIGHHFQTAWITAQESLAKIKTAPPVSPSHQTQAHTAKHLSKCRPAIFCDCFTVHGFGSGSYISRGVRSTVSYWHEAANKHSILWPLDFMSSCIQQPDK